MFYIPPSDLPADLVEQHQPADRVVSEDYRIVFAEEATAEEATPVAEETPATVVEEAAPAAEETVETEPPAEKATPIAEETTETVAEEASPVEETVEAQEVVEETAPVETPEEKPAEVVEAEAEMGDTGAEDTAVEETTVVEEAPTADGIGTSPSDADITVAAEKIRAIFADGFQWADLCTMVREAYSFMSAYPDVTGSERRDAVNNIIFRLIDITDTPYLPDSYTDPLFKALVPTFTSLVGSVVEGWIDENNIFADRPGMEGMPTKEAITDAAQEIRATFADGFQWADLGTSVRIAVQFARALKDLDTPQRKEVVVQVVNTLIDITDTPYLPDAFVDPVFKATVPPFVDDIFAALGQ